MSEISPSPTIRPLALSIKAAANALGVGRTRMYELLANGEISAVRCGRRVLIPIAQIEKYFANLPEANFRPTGIASTSFRTAIRR